MNKVRALSQTRCEHSMNKAWASREQSLGIERTDFGYLVPIMRATSAQNKLQELGNTTNS